MTEKQAVMWNPPPTDQTPLETGGAVVIVRLTPAETTRLLAFAPTLHEAVHMLIDAEEPRPATQSSAPGDGSNCETCGHNLGLHLGGCSFLLFPEGYAGGAATVPTCGCRGWDRPGRVVTHMHQGKDGCRTCDRKWSDHTIEERSLR